MSLAQSLRDWLTNNKVFFEVFSWIGLGVMSIIVSVASLQVAQLQTNLQRAQVSPSLNIHLESVYDKESSFFRDEILHVSNDGFAISEFSATLNSMLEIARTRSGRRSVSYLPIGYLCCGFVTNSSTGLLVTYKQPDNNSQMSRFEKEILDLNMASKEERYDVRLINILSANYKDSIGERQTRYFLVWPITGAIEVNAVEGHQWIGRYEVSSRLQIDVSKVSATALPELFEKACGLSSGCS